MERSIAINVTDVKVTSLGHAGMLIETEDATIVCDPWFYPAFHASWCVFPRNDQLSNEVLAKIETTQFLYISHLHSDHFDEKWLSEHIDRSATVLLPDFPTGEMEKRLRHLGFTNFVATKNGAEIALTPATSIAIHCETAIADGPGGDSALVVSDSTARIVNQNDCRTSDLHALGSHGPIDLHWLQYSGAIWYPMVYDEDRATMRKLVDDKVASQFSRALRYVEALNARAIVPSAGPPAFLDPSLFRFNVVKGDELSIFPDQRSFLSLLDQQDFDGILAIPGTEIVVDQQSINVHHPLTQTEVDEIFSMKADYLQRYQDDWLPYIEAEKESWAEPTSDLIERLADWWEPLLRTAPTLCSLVNDVVLVDLGDECIAIDFRTATVSRADRQSEHGFRFTIDRRLVETVAAQKAVDWSDSLFLSCRFSAWRRGPYNEYVYNFFKSLSEERMARAEQEARRRIQSTDSVDEIRIGNWIVEAKCPHRGADLSVFGHLEGDVLVCQLHGWKFDCQTGKCLTAEEKRLKIRPAD